MLDIQTLKASMFICTWLQAIVGLILLQSVSY